MNPIFTWISNMKEVPMSVNRMSNQDMRELLTIAGTALEIGNADEQLSEVLRFLEQIFKTSSNNFFFAHRNSPSLDLNRTIYRGIDKKYILQFDEYYHKLDPYYKAWSSNPSSNVITTDHSKHSPSTNEYYNEFMKPQAIKYQMSLYLRNKRRFFGVLSLFRSHGANRFTSLDQTKARQLVPYLSGALEKALILEHQTEQEAIIDTITRELPYEGIIVMDQSLNTIYQNESAGDIISRLNKETGRLHVSSLPFPEEIYLFCRELLDIARQAGTNKKLTQKLDFTSQISKQKISIYLRVIRTTDGSPLLLLGLDRDKTLSDPSGMLEKKGLSNRELEVVSLISKGMKNKEIGERLFISEYTVENHLRSIYRKLNVKNRTEAAHRLLQLSTRSN